MSANRLEDIEIGRKIWGSKHVSIHHPDLEDGEVYLKRRTFRKRVKSLLDIEKARNFKEDLGIRIYKVYLKIKERGGMYSSQLIGHLTEKTIREKFPLSYRFLSYLNPKRFTLKDIKSIDSYILI